MTDKEFEKLLVSQLEIIDQILIKHEIDIPDRPFTAADMFVRECIVQVNDDPPDNYNIQPWFKHIIIPINEWYKNKYGAATIRPKEKTAKGVVLYNGAFYELSIPLRVIVPKGERKDFIFPKEMLPIENESDFVTNEPGFDHDPEGAKVFYRDVRHIVDITRSISNNLLNREFKYVQCNELSAGILSHIQKAVDDILTGENGRYLYFYWEIQLALEKAIKVLIVQSNGQNRNIHDLIELWEDLEKLNPGLISRDHFAKFLTPKQAINYRYGHGPNIKKVDLHAYYIGALRLLDILTQHFDRRTTFQNTVFVLGKLPWQT